LLLAWLSERDFHERDPDAGDSDAAWWARAEQPPDSSFCQLADEVFEHLGRAID